MINKETRAIVEALSTKLSSEWEIKAFGNGVIVGHKAATENESELPANFQIWPEADLWTAVWWPPLTLDELIDVEPTCVSGVEERCIEWVLERAESV